MQPLRLAVGEGLDRVGAEEALRQEVAENRDPPQPATTHVEGMGS